MRIVTHNAKFHTDDVFAVAALTILYPNAEIIRTRDEELIKKADMVVDVGEIDNPDKDRFDHHQAGGAGERKNGVPYSSLGLVWKKYGQELSKSQEVYERIDKIFVQPIDAGDNGVNTFTNIIPDVYPYLINNIVNSYRLTWKEDDDWNKRFEECLLWARSFLSRIIKIQQDILEGEKIVLKSYESSKDKRLVVVSEEYSLGRELVTSVLTKLKEPIYAVLFRGDHKSWQLVAINKDSGSFETRKPLPEKWRAKHDKEFDDASGVIGGVFCHRNGFMCAINTKEAALKLAEIALNT